MLRSLPLLLVLLAQPVLAQTPPTAASIGALVEQFHDAGLFSGAILVAEHGEVLYAGGSGLADASWGLPNTPDTRFRIGSVTKQFTAALVLQLVEEGRLDLDAPVTRYLPDYPAASGDRITLHHLLSHTSGIPDITSLPTFAAEIERDAFTPDSLMTVFSGLDLVFEPGKGAAYSSSGYIVLGAILERVTGEPYARLLQERLLGPLGLHDTVYDDGRSVIPRMAQGYTRVAGTLERAEYIDPSVPYAAGMMVSTVHDLQRWAEALYRGDPFQHPETAERMRTPVTGPVAYGLMVYDQPVGALAVPTVIHGGAIPGFTSALAYMPREGLTLVVIDNTFGDVTPVLVGVTALLYGQPVKTPRPGIADVVARVIETEGVEAAAARYRALRATEPNGYDVSRAQLNDLGYVYLHRGNTATAIAVFALNAEAYPEASNTYDSLAEAYLAAGDEVQATANYRRALDLDPQSASARTALTRLGVVTSAAPEAPGIAVPKAVLERHVGRYELQPGVVLSVTIDHDLLMAGLPGQSPLEMVAGSETTFIVAGLGAEITFHRASDGSTESLTLHQNGAERTAPRVE